MASVVSVILCLAMLIGTTFAWFTDEVTSGKNTINVGKLDIAFSYRNASMETFKEITKDTTGLVTDKNGKAMVWEPGAASVTYLKIENVGNLALKYNLSISAKDVVKGKDGAALSKVLKTAVVELTEEQVGKFTTRSAAIKEATAAGAESVLTYVKNGEMKAGDAAEYLAMIIYFPEEIGNVYNGERYNLEAGKEALKTELNLNIFATQLQDEDESDAFGTDYDKEAPFANPVAMGSGTHTVDLEKTPVKASGCNGAIQAKAGAQVTINGNGTVHAIGEKGPNDKKEYAMAVWARGEGTEVTINGGNYTNEVADLEGGDPHRDLIYASNGGKIVINGGTFKSVTPKWTLNIRNEDYGKSDIIVKGGSFYNYNPAESYTDELGAEKPTNFVAEGYTVIEEGDWCTVVEANSVFKDGGEVNFESNYIMVDASANGCNVINKDTTVNFGDKTLTLDLPDATAETKNWMGVNITGGNVVFNGTTGGVKTAANDELYAVYVRGGATLTINGGSYIGGMDAVCVGEGTLIINGGFFASQVTYESQVTSKEEYWVINCIDTNYKDGTAKVTITGGTFVNFNPANNHCEGANTNFVAEGYTVKAEKQDNGDTWYTVIPE